MESNYTKEVYDRIQKLEPENVSKIVGYLMLQDDGGRDMIRLAFSPDNVLCSLINKAKSALGLSKPAGSVPISPLQATTQLPVSDLPFHLAPYPPVASTRPSLSPTTTLLAGSQYWDLQVPAEQQILHNPDLVQQGYADSTAEDYHFQNQMQMLSLEDQFEYANSIASDFSSNYYCPEPAMGVRTSRRSPTSPEFRKVCHYFNKGFCKHGNACRYLHSHNPMTDSFPHIFTSNSNELSNDDHVISPGSLEKLERELTELLKSRRGSPISIASLPMTYYEKYGRTLQAEGYLTESQRHGKAGYSLTKLLARLKNSIRVIDRPHGQHSVILAEDVPRYLEYAGDKNEPGSIVAGSQQIYLTFPADSSFSEQDVSNYFNKYGPVRDVRIPCQQKRMFGFVTFVYPETVKQILSKGNPHFVCGARVLVKPYREKSKLAERKLTERMLNPMCFHQHFTEGDSELHSSSRMFENSSLLRKQLMLENEQTFELERCFAEMNLNANPLSHPPHYGYSIDELKLQEPRAEQSFNYLFNALNTASTSEEKLRNISTNYKDKDSQGLDLPESLFASAIGSLSTVL